MDNKFEISKRIKKELDEKLTVALETQAQEKLVNVTTEEEAVKVLGDIVFDVSKNSILELTEKYNTKPQKLEISVSGEEYLTILLTQLSNSDTLDLKDINPNIFDKLQNFPKKINLSYNITFGEYDTIIGEHKFSPAKDLNKIKDFLKELVSEIAYKKAVKENPEIENNKEIFEKLMDSIMRVLDLRFHQGKGDSIKILEHSNSLKELIKSSKTISFETNDGEIINNKEDAIKKVEELHQKATFEYENPPVLIKNILGGLKFR